MTAFIGIILGVLVVLMANHAEGDSPDVLLKTGAAIIVFGGTFAALLVHGGARRLLGAVKALRFLIKPPATDSWKFLNDVCQWADVARKNGIISLEAEADQLTDRYLKIGLSMMVNNEPYERVRETLFMAGDVEDRDGESAAELWEAAGGYAPTIGVLGAVLGLINVMLHLDHPSELGPGIATAFVATVYGLFSANVVFIPVGARLKTIAASRAAFREVAMEGMLMLSRQESPLRIRTFLEHLLDPRRKGGGDEEREGAAPEFETSPAE